MGFDRLILGEHLKDLLAGQILWVTWDQIVVVALVYAGLLAAWFAFRDRFGRAGFYVIFAIAVTSPVQLVGVYLVFACLIMPALATRKIRRGNPLIVGYLAGAVGLAAGLALSALFDLSTGPTVVTAMAASCLCFVWVPQGLSGRSPRADSKTASARHRGH